jgi:hypothetical protein
MEPMRKLPATLLELVKLENKLVSFRRLTVCREPALPAPWLRATTLLCGHHSP